MHQAVGYKAIRQFCATFSRDGAGDGEPGHNAMDMLHEREAVEGDVLPSEACGVALSTKADNWRLYDKTGLSNVASAMHPNECFAVCPSMVHRMDV